MDLSGAGLCGAQLIPPDRSVIPPDRSGFGCGSSRTRAEFTYYINNYMETNFTGASFSLAVLQAIDFSKADLSSVSFVGAYLHGCTFAESSLNGTNFSGARVVACNFARANLQGADFKGVAFTNCVFTDADMHNTKCDSATFTGCAFGGLRLSNTVFVGCSFIKSQVERKSNQAGLPDRFPFNRPVDVKLFARLAPPTVLSSCDFRDCDFGGSDLTGGRSVRAGRRQEQLMVELDTAQQEEARLTQQLGQIDARHPNFCKVDAELRWHSDNVSRLQAEAVAWDDAGERMACDLSMTAWGQPVDWPVAVYSMEEADVDRGHPFNHRKATGMEGGNSHRVVRSVDLAGAMVSGASFDGCEMTNVNLAGTSLRGCSFRGASLCLASLRGADASEADFTGADLSCANLEGATFSRADLREASFWCALALGAQMARNGFRRNDSPPFQGNPFPNMGTVPKDQLVLTSTSVQEGTCALVDPSTTEQELRKSSVGDAPNGDSNGPQPYLRAHASCVGTVFAGAMMHGADLRGVSLRGADLRGALLCYASLAGADMTDAQCDGAIGPFDRGEEAQE
jgi:uncharacterized protein YjbI with pentapeptide repeats